MQPGERIEIIKRIATRLAADDWADIDLVLEQFGFETEWRWEGDAKSYVVHCIKNNSDGKLSALDHYLMGHSRPDEEPWEDGRFRLFLSHLAQHKATATASAAAVQPPSSTATTPTSSPRKDGNHMNSSPDTSGCNVGRKL